MKHKQYLPRPLLGDYVKSLWTSERDFQPPHDRFELLPDSQIELVFSFGDRLAIEDGESVYDWPRCCVVGLMDGPVRLRARGVVRSVAARFFAWGFFPLFDLDMPQLPNAIHQLNNTWERLGDEIAKAVEKEADESAVETLHNFLMERALAKKLRPNEVQAAARLLFRRKGRGKLSDLQDHAYYSTRQLERKFKQQMGVSPETQQELIGKQLTNMLVAIETSDFDQTYRAMKERGVEFVEEAVPAPWGKQAVFRDLYGNLFDLLEQRDG